MDNEDFGPVVMRSGTPGKINTPEVTGFGAQAFSNVCRIMLNLDKAELVEHLVMHDGEGGNDWKRFNDDPLIFVAKLDDKKLLALWELILTKTDWEN